MGIGQAIYKRIKEIGLVLVRFLISNRSDHNKYCGLLFFPKNTTLSAGDFLAKKRIIFREIHRIWQFYCRIMIDLCRGCGILKHMEWLMERDTWNGF